MRSLLFTIYFRCKYFLSSNNVSPLRSPNMTKDDFNKKKINVNVRVVARFKQGDKKIFERIWE